MGGANGLRSITLLRLGKPGGGQFEGAEVIKEGGIIRELRDALRLEGIQMEGMDMGGFPNWAVMGGRPLFPAEAGEGSGAIPCTSCLCFFK